LKSAGELIAMFSNLPFYDLDQVATDGTSLVVAPHPDDESLGCGGFIAESCARGRPPVVVVMTDGTASHPSSPSYPPDRLRALRENETRAALSMLGLSWERLHFMRLRDSAMPLGGRPFDLAAAELRRVILDYRCKTIFAPWLHDPHCDHETTQLMVRVAVKSLSIPVYSYPVWGWLLPPAQLLAADTIEGWRLNITVHLDRKRRAIASHRSQYSDLINDDPKGFRLPSELLSTFERPYETFIQTLT
jgi:LmbE family N-acetylglucosaminyl deacetylase